MMRERSSGFQNLVACRVFKFKIDFLRVRHAFVRERKVEVDTDAGPIELRNAGRAHSLSRQPTADVFVSQTALDVVAKREGFTPGDGGLERFGDDVVRHQEIADVRNAEYQLISAPAVLTAGFHAAVSRRNAIDVAFLLPDFLAAAFEHERAYHHFVGIKSFDFQDEEFLDLALQVGDGAGRLRFQSLAEMKLDVVQQPHTCRQGYFAREVVHESEALFNVGKRMDPYLW